jgi:ParB family chromosome partitioning protein
MEFGDFDIFAAKDEVATQTRVLSLDPDRVYPDPHNVRRAIDEIEIAALAASIGDRGQLQPITVAAADQEGRHMIHFGERRWRACQSLGLAVRAIISDQADIDQIRIDQFVENDQRPPLSSSDMIAFVAAQVKGGRSITELARATGRDRARLARYHALASAPDFITARIDEMPLRGAIALLGAAAKDEAATRAFVASASTYNLTVVDCEKFSRRLETDDSKVGSINKTVDEEPPQKSEHALRSGPLSSAKSSDRSKASSDAQTFTHEEQYIEVNGRRARIMMAVLKFDGDDDVQTVHFTT